jgi:hypothetical protein
MARTANPLPGFNMPPAAGGAIYQGVARQFRAMFPKDDPDAQRMKENLRGWTALALSHARALDHVAGATVGRAQTSTELRETLAYIAEAMVSGDAFDDFLEDLRNDTATAPHTPTP